MRKLLAAIIVTTVMVFGGSVFAATPQEQEQSAEPNHWSSFSTIDGIPIPDEVLLSVQINNQGFAVTKASEVRRNGLMLYRLRVDKSDIPTDSDGFYLFFTKDWWLMDRSEIDEPTRRDNKRGREEGEDRETQPEQAPPEQSEERPDEDDEPADEEPVEPDPDEELPEEEPTEPEEPNIKPPRPPRRPRN